MESLALTLTLTLPPHTTSHTQGSREPTEGPDHDRHVQGGLLGDGLWSILACLGTSMPNTTFSQNNGACGPICLL